MKTPPSSYLALVLFIIVVGFLFTMSSKAPTPDREQSPLAGAVNTVGGISYYLYGSGVASTDTSVTLTSFKQPVNNYPLAMTDFGTVGYLTLEPGNSSRQEFVSFTGVTQNADGTATLTGVTRGLAPVSPYTASTTIRKAHSGGTVAVISNPPQLYETLLSKNNIGTSTAIIIVSSTTPPRYDSVAAQGTGTHIATTSELASVAYVNATALVSAPNGTASVKGVYQSATALQTGSSTALGSTGASLALISANATDTPQYGCAVGYTGTAGAGCSVVASLLGKIKQAWIDLTADFTFTGAINIAASVSKNLTLNALAYVFPSSHAVGALFNDGSGTLTWGATWQRLVSTTTTAAMVYATTTTFSTYSNLRVVYNQPSAAGNAYSLTVRFNSDAGNNYSHSGQSLFGSFASVQTSGTSVIDVTAQNATTSPIYTTIDIVNSASNVKVAQWQTAAYTAASAPGIVRGGGIWSNTTAAITSIVFRGDSASGIPVGTIIQVYGSN